VQYPKRLLCNVNTLDSLFTAMPGSVGLGYAKWGLSRKFFVLYPDQNLRDANVVCRVVS